MGLPRVGHDSVTKHARTFTFHLPKGALCILSRFIVTFSGGTEWNVLAIEPQEQRLKRGYHHRFYRHEIRHTILNSLCQ